MAKELGLSIIW